MLTHGLGRLGLGLAMVRYNFIYVGASSRNERIVLLRLIVASYVNKKGF